jgi:hypothetical protein
MLESAVAGARSYGRGATAGLLKYPMAGILKGIDAVKGGDRTYDEALAALEKGEREDAERHPTASAVGEGVSMAASIPAFLKGGAKKITAKEVDENAAALAKGVFTGQSASAGKMSDAAFRANLKDLPLPVKGSKNKPASEMTLEELKRQLALDDFAKITKGK